MTDDPTDDPTGHGKVTVAAVVLAAGAGTRLRPLTLQRPKPLCPVGNRALLDWSLDRVTAVTSRVAVNLHEGKPAMEAHLADRPVQLSPEAPEALGTAGALGQLRWWIDGNPTLVLNADTYTEADLAAFVDGWDGERVRLLLYESDRLLAGAGVAAALMPWSIVSGLEPVPSGLFSCVWVPAAASGRLDVVRYDGPFFDCGTPSSYLAANRYLAQRAPGGSLIDPAAVVSGDATGSVVGPGAVVEGIARDSVIWAGAQVGRHELLDRAIRTDADSTVLVR